MIEHLSLPAPLTARGRQLLVRRATPDDLDAVIRLLTDDPVSAGRGDVAVDGDRAAYADALRRITADAGNELLVAVDDTARVVGTLQLTVISGMARRGLSLIHI